MRKFWIASVTALTLAGVPTAAFAAKPVHPVHPTTPAVTSDNDSNHPATPTVMFVLRGTLNCPTAPTSGSVSITVKSSNFEKILLQKMTLTFVVNSQTTVVLHQGKAIATCDRGIVKVRALKKASILTLESKTAFEVIDQGSSS